MSFVTGNPQCFHWGSRANKTGIVSRGASHSCFVIPPDSYRNDRIIVFFSLQLKQNLKTMVKLIWFDEEQHILVKMTQLFSYLATAIEERVAEHGRPIFGATLKAWRHKTVRFSPLLIWYAFAIISPFYWIMKAFSREKRCLTSIAFWDQTDLPLF